MLKQKITSLMLGLLIITSMACNSECDEPTKVPLKQLSDYVSYTGYDTLRFLHNNTDTQVFIGQGINYFWVRKPAFDDTQCPEDHQSLSIQFKNQSNGDILTMEYVYDHNQFEPSMDYGINSFTYYKFYFMDHKWIIGSKLFMSGKPFIINGYSYPTLTFFTEGGDTSQNYLAFRNVFNGDFGGIVKIKQIGDTLTLIR
jgi:hypothetical protein